MSNINWITDGSLPKVSGTYLVSIRRYRWDGMYPQVCLMDYRDSGWVLSDSPNYGTTYGEQIVVEAWAEVNPPTFGESIPKENL